MGSAMSGVKSLTTASMAAKFSQRDSTNDASCRFSWRITCIMALIRATSVPGFCAR